VAIAGLEDFWKGGSEPITLAEKKLRSVGRKWVYLFNRAKARKLIPGERLVLGTAPVKQPRGSERRPQKMVLTLLAKMQGVEFLQPAHTMNVSETGLGILTDGPIEPSRPLHPGQIVYVYGAANEGLGFCRVVWVHTENADLPSKAGLRFLN